MKFDLSAAWNVALALLRSHMAVILPVVGVFIFLPTLLLGYFLPQPVMDGATDMTSFVAVFNSWARDNAPWLFLSTLVTSVGTLAVLAIFLKPAGLSVADALKIAAIALLPSIVAGFLYGIVIGFGLVLLIIPGLYLLARFSLVQQALIAEDIRNPLTAIGRSWELTKGNGWRILGFVVIVIIVALVVSGIFNGLFALVLNLALPGELGRFLTVFVDSAVESALGILLAAIFAAVYRQLSGPMAADLASTFE